MNITIEELLKIVGSLYVENQMLRKELEALKAATEKSIVKEKDKVPKA